MEIRRTEKEIDEVHGLLLLFFEPHHDPNVTRCPMLSFECGSVAMLDWLLGIDSEYAQIIEDGIKKGSFDVG